MYDQTNAKYGGESKIWARVYNGTGFFGDIATVSLNLTKYGDLSGAKGISFFAKSLERAPVGSKPVFSDLRIWKDWNSAD